MQSLNQALTEIDVMQPPKQYIKNIIQVTCDKLDYLFGTVTEIDENGEAHMLTSYNLPENYPEMVNKVEAPILSGPAGEAYETGKILVVHNPFSDPRLAPWKGMEIITGPIETIIWVPIFKSGKVFGICAYHSENKKEMSDYDLSVLEQIGVMISIAITGNQYLDNLVGKTDELEKEIIERKKTENKLQQLSDELEIKVEERTSELSKVNKKLQLFRYQIDQSNDAIFVIDPETAIILDANENACTSLGYSREELLSTKAIDFGMKYQDIDLWKDHVAEMRINDYQTIAGVGTHKRRDGTTFPVEVNSKLITQDEKEYLVAVVRDITERKQAEETLRESEDKFRTLVTNTEEIIYMIDKDGTFTLSEGKGLSKLGLNPGQVVGKSVFEVYGDNPDILNAITKALNGETVVVEVTFDGIYFRSWHTPHKNNNGEIIGLLGLSVNITERKQAQKELLLSEARLMALLKISQMKDATVGEIADFVLQKGIKLTESKIGYLSAVNEDESIQTVLSYSKDVMEQCNLNNQIEFITKDLGLGGECIRQRKPIIINDYSKSHPGKKGYPDTHLPLFRYLSIPLFYKGKIVATISVANKEDEYNELDVQQLTLLMNGMWEHIKRTEYEKKLIDTNNYLDTIVSMSLDGIFVIDGEGRFEFVNNACCEMSGYTSEELIGKPFMEIIPHEYTDFMLSKWHEVQAGEGGLYETVIIKKNGTRRNLLVSHTDVMLNEQQKYCVIAKDITSDVTEYINTILESMKENSEG